MVGDGFSMETTTHHLVNITNREIKNAIRLVVRMKKEIAIRKTKARHRGH